MNPNLRRRSRISTSTSHDQESGDVRRHAYRLPRHGSTKRKKKRGEDDEGEGDDDDDEEVLSNNNEEDDEQRELEASPSELRSTPVALGPLRDPFLPSSFAEPSSSSIAGQPPHPASTSPVCQRPPGRSSDQNVNARIDQLAKYRRRL